jgi:MFS family permease
MRYLNSYLRFAAANLRFLAFGFVMLLASSFGQTYFIGIFGPSVRAEFGLSHTSWGAVYMAGTLLSALVLPWSGQLIDRVDLPRYTVFVIIALAGACLFMALTPSLAFLVVAIFALRQTGQGLMSHTSATAMVRYFPADRGKAVALASLGFGLAEAVLPVLMVLSIASIGWRATYGVAALVCLVLVLPCALWLLRGHGLRHERYEAYQQQRQASQPRGGSWSRRDVIRDLRFYLLLPAALAPSFIGTALFFHHLSLAEMKGWDAAWFTGSYWIYAVGSVLSALAAGPLIDRLSAVRVLPMYLLPLVLGLVLVWAFSNVWWSWPYLFCLGVTSGIMFTGLPSLWAEIYGVGNLGAIKSLNTALSVFASALGPIVMGVMMDRGVSIENICLVFAAYCLMASWLLLLTLKTFHIGSR